MSDLPRAAVREEHASRLAWILPVLALALVVFFGWQAWQERGLDVRISFEQGHGIKPGDTVRYRGITLGEVRAVRLDESLEHVELDVRLERKASALAREGARFWIVRPQVSLAGIAGLETIVGARYIELLPGPSSAERRSRFAGLESPPVYEGLQPGGLEVRLLAARRGSLSPSVPVYYRQTQVGRVLSVQLTSDGNAVEALAYIEPMYAPLVRERTRFWRASGIDVEANLRGVRMRTESLQTLLFGGVALATPENAGSPARPLQAFELAEEPEEEWQTWQPSIPLGSSILPAGSSLPRPTRAKLTWTKDGMFGREQEREGWVLALENGLLGPADVLQPAGDVERGTAVLELVDQRFEIAGPPAWEHHGLALRELDPPVTPWPSAAVRRPSAPEDCLVVADPALAPLAIGADRLTADGELWRVDGSLAIDADWHGAAVLARADGRLIGIALCDDDEWSVATLQRF